MSRDTELDDHSRIRTLEAEVRSLRQRLGQREQLLTTLNRRLLQLERGENGISGMERAEAGGLLSDYQYLQAQNGPLQAKNHALQEENTDLHEQLRLLRSTKLFRWSSPARDVYAKIRHSK